MRMPKQVVNFRLSKEAVKALDTWAARRNISRTAMLEIVLWAERERQKPISEREYLHVEPIGPEISPKPGHEYEFNGRKLRSHLDAVSTGQGKASVETFRPLERPRVSIPKPGKRKKE